MNDNYEFAESFRFGGARHWFIFDGRRQEIYGQQWYGVFQKADIANFKNSHAFYAETILPSCDKDIKLCLKLETDFDNLMI